MVNHRQELFCQGIVAGKSATQAYISAGFSPNNANSAAAKLYAKLPVKARIAELMAETTSETILNVVQRKELLSDIARTMGKGSVFAIAELNKMEGVYPAAETNVNVKGKLKTEQTAIVVGNGNLTSALSSLVDAGAVRVNVN